MIMWLLRSLCRQLITCTRGSCEYRQCLTQLQVTICHCCMPRQSSLPGTHISMQRCAV